MMAGPKESLWEGEKIQQKAINFNGSPSITQCTVPSRIYNWEMSTQAFKLAWNTPSNCTGIEMTKKSIKILKGELLLN